MPNCVDWGEDSAAEHLKSSSDVASAEGLEGREQHSGHLTKGCSEPRRNRIRAADQTGDGGVEISEHLGGCSGDQWRCLNEELSGDGVGQVGRDQSADVRNRPADTEGLQQCEDVAERKCDPGECNLCRGGRRHLRTQCRERQGGTGADRCQCDRTGPDDGDHPRGQM